MKMRQPKKSKADTVTAKLPDDSKSPQTGDNSNPIMWIALLIISGGVMKGVTAFGKSKNILPKLISNILRSVMEI